METIRKLKDESKQKDNKIVELETKIDTHLNETHLKSCEDYKSKGFKSGYRLIDSSEEPIKVFCDFEKDVTVISPKTRSFRFKNENKTTAISYNPNVEQLNYLMNKPGSCSQEILIECFDMPITYEHFWWIDREGK